MVRIENGVPFRHAITLWAYIVDGCYDFRLAVESVNQVLVDVGIVDNNYFVKIKYLIDCWYLNEHISLAWQLNFVVYAIWQYKLAKEFDPTSYGGI